MSGLLPSLENFAKGTLATAAGLSTVGVGLLYYGQNYLIYPSAFPPGSRTDVATPQDYGLQYRDLELQAEDGVKLKCYLLVQSKGLAGSGAASMAIPEELSDDEFAASRPTIMMFHGNGGNVGHRIPLAKVFFYKMRCNVLMMSYRGYGLSEGTPSEKGLKMDAQSGLDYIISDSVLSQTAVILYGQSIGGAVSIDLASRNPLAIRALILENTFLSLPRLVPSALPVLGPFAFLCHQKWDSASKVPLIPRKTPILMLSGVKDEVVPHEHMQGLWDIVKRREAAPPSSSPSSPTNPTGLKNRKLSGIGGVTAEDVPAGRATEEPHITVDAVDPRSLSKFIEFEKGTHNDTCVQPGYWAAVAEFIASLGQWRASSA